MTTSTLTATPPGRAADTAGQLAWFTLIGVVATLAYLVLYQGLRGVVGAQPANLLAWLVTAVADTSANRRLTFGVTGREGAGRAQAEGLVVLGLGLAMTSGSLSALDVLVAEPGATLETAVLVAANLAAGLVRFVLLRVWVFHEGRG